jgi:hypothetical protein
LTRPVRTFVKASAFAGPAHHKVRPPPITRISPITNDEAGLAAGLAVAAEPPLATL